MNSNKVVQSGDKVEVTQALSDGRYKTFILDVDHQLLTDFLIGVEVGSIVKKGSNTFRIVRITRSIGEADKKAWWSFMKENYPDNYDAASDYYTKKSKYATSASILINDWFADKNLPKITATDGLIRVNGMAVAKYSEGGVVHVVD